MNSIRFALLLSLLSAAVPGCAAQSHYAPQSIAQGELTARYDDNVELWAGGEPVARGWGYDGLPEYVACVPDAANHARAARSAGSTATALSVVGGVLGIS